MPAKTTICCRILACAVVLSALVLLVINVLFDTRYPASYTHRIVAVPRTILDLIVPVRHRSAMTVKHRLSSLIDLPDPTTGAWRSGNDSPSDSVHQVLWYNIPVWISPAESNRDVASCPYSNCVFMAGKDRRLVMNSSAVIFSIGEADMGYGPPISPRERDPDQVWVFFTMESPLNLGRWHYRHAQWHGTMNWSMTYRMDSDIVYSYGALETRKVVPSRDYGSIYRRKSGFAAWIVSHCGADSGRDEYVRELQDHGIPVHVYGRCGQPLDRNPQELVETYKFYISFENSLCVDYVSEKFFKYFQMDTILVVRGGADYNKLLPSNAFINTDNFHSVSELARFLLKVNSSEELYTDYLKARDKYTMKRFLPHSTCMLCERLNNKDTYRKVYDDMISYLFQDACHPATDIADTTSTTWMYLLCLPILTLLGCQLMRLTYSRYVHALFTRLTTGPFH